MCDIVKIWRICLLFEYNRRDLFEGLDNFLKKYKDAEILDCACGTGFVLLDLAKKGYNITFSDGNQQMLNHLQRKAEIMGINLKAIYARWEELPKKINKKFDLVICRGCSLPYAGSWNYKQANNVEIIKESLKNFYNILKPGGTLYVDTITEKSAKTEGVEFYLYEPKIINGCEVELSETIKTNKIKKIRTWIPIINIDGKKISITRYSYFLSPEELNELLLATGFVDITRANITGEHYSVFLARKPI